ncbi:MAG: glycoside hydrolase family 6 protein [Chloroflexi bacterium]|nr:glycoside hydrolase family 6 protein [Chloroflexota bacterium]
MATADAGEPTAAARPARPRFIMGAGALALGVVGLVTLVGAALMHHSVLYVPEPDAAANAQIDALRAGGGAADAALIEAMVAEPQAVWFTAASPADVEQAVGSTLRRAGRSVAVLVAYNIPGRDCGGQSAGGARSPAEYAAWIDGFAAGVGDGHAIVILEPDAIGLLPSDCGSGFPFTDADRYAELNHAAGVLGSLPNARVYLDATHSAWLGVGEVASRLVRAGVGDADGFFLNVSNYQFSANLVQYGTWISKCLAMGGVANCPDQSWNGGPAPAMIAELLGEGTGVALSPYGEWSDTSTNPELNTSGLNLRYAGVSGATHFVIDTSRNGRGPWTTATPYPDRQDWCNPPRRGLGLRPTLDTRVSLLDAYLWVKIPGESDGTCTRGGPAGSADPEWGVVEPAAGEWFPEQALELARLAKPPLVP